jgi:hypothetical protein
MKHFAIHPVFLLTINKGYATIAIECDTTAAVSTLFECPLTAGLSFNCILANLSSLSRIFHI